MPAPTINLTLTNIETGKLATIEDLETEVNEALAYLHGVANPEDRIRAEDAADNAEGFAEDAAESASEAESSAVDANLSEQQSRAAAILAGAPIAPALPTDDTETAALPSPFLFIAPEGVQSWTHGGTLASLTQGPHVSRVEFDDVVALKAYNGPALPVGLIIRTRKEGFAYEVAASGATDQHVTTAGGVKLYALPGADGRYSAAQFAELPRAFAVAARARKPLILTGAYTIDERLLEITSGDGELHLHCVGSVVIEVDSGSEWLRDLILLQTDTINHCSVTGGRLTILGNSKISSGLWFRHLEAADGGSVILDCPVEVFGLEGAESPAVAVSGIMTLGRYERIVMRSPRVEDVTRLSAGGECSGITCSGFAGDVEIYSPVVKRIFTGPSLADADGIKTFGHAPGGTLSSRRGRVRIYDPVYEDCQGRSHKDQCGDAVIYRPRVIRDAAVVQAISNSSEFEFQFGGGLVIDPICDYSADGATSPLGSSSSIATFKHILDDAEMVSRMANLTLISDVAVPRAVLGFYHADAQRSLIDIDGVRLMPKAGFTTTMLSRGVVEVNMDTLASKATKTRIKVRGVDGPNTLPVIAYTSYDGVDDVSDKLSWSVTDCNNPLGPAGAQTRPFSQISGSPVLAVEEFEMHGLKGYRDFYNGAWALDFSKLTPGTVISVDIAAVDAANAPDWGESGYAHIRCEGAWFGASDRTVWVVKGTATNVWFTMNGGTNWGVVV